jgi:hypothetical protein
MRWQAILLAILATLGSTAATGQGRLLEKCARGQLEVCFSLLSRPRLEPGRRAAIELHLAEVDKLAAACAAHDQPACAMLADRYPDLPPDLTPKRRSPAD